MSLFTVFVMGGNANMLNYSSSCFICFLQKEPLVFAAVASVFRYKTLIKYETVHLILFETIVSLLLF